MKTTKFFLAAVLGTAAVLLLTLHIWGREWYKVISSLAIGMTFGLMIALLLTEPKRFFEIIKLSFSKAGSILRALKMKRIKIKLPRVEFSDFITPIKNITWKNTVLTIKKIFSFLIWRAFLNLPIALAVFGIYELTLFLEQSGFIRNGFPTLVNLALECLLMAVVTIAFNVFFCVWISGYKQKNKYFEKLAKWIGGIGKPKNKCSYFWYTYFGLFIISVVMFTTWIVRAIFLLFLPTLIQVVLTIPIAIFALLRTVRESGWFILVVFSIVMGGSLGTIHNSWTIGILTTTISFFMPLLTKLFTKKAEILFFFKKKEIFYFLWRVVDPMGRM